MSHWNHRIVRTRYTDDPSCTERLALHEVHYDDDGKPRGYSADPADVVAFDGEEEGEGPASVESLRWTLRKMLEACDKPILDLADFPVSQPESRA